MYFSEVYKLQQVVHIIPHFQYYPNLHTSTLQHCWNNNTPASKRIQFKWKRGVESVQKYIVRLGGSNRRHLLLSPLKWCITAEESFCSKYWVTSYQSRITYSYFSSLCKLHLLPIDVLFSIYAIWQNFSQRNFWDLFKNLIWLCL